MTSGIPKIPNAVSRVIGQMPITFAFIFLANLVLITSCSTAPDEIVERTVEKIYNSAMDQLEAGEVIAAAVEFDEVERQHPYSIWARKAQIMSAYSYYLNNNYDEAILTARRFLELHPGHVDAPYAHYLAAISYYDQIADVGRDQKITKQAMDALTAVVKKYPDSSYARDATFKLDLVRDHLAGKEMEIGRFYLRRQKFTAAINRFRFVLENYQTTAHMPEALHRLTEAYLSVGIVVEAQAAAAVLGYNYPESDWYRRSYALLTGKNLKPEGSEDSWIAKIWKSIF